MISGEPDMQRCTGSYGYGPAINRDYKRRKAKL
jgi:hypothetical protein